MNTVSVSGSSFSPDESRILFSSNKTGIWNAYTIPEKKNQIEGYSAMLKFLDKHLKGKAAGTR